MQKGNRLSIAECELIRSNFLQGMAIVDIAKKFNLTNRAVNSLLVGDTYKGVYKVKEKNNRAKGKEVLLVVNNIPVKFSSVRKLAKALGLDESSISNIIAGRHPMPVITEIRFEH